MGKYLSKKWLLLWSHLSLWRIARKNSPLITLASTPVSWARRSRTLSMTDSEDSWTIRLRTTLKTMSWSVSVCRPTRLTNGYPSGLPRQRRNLTFWLHGSQETRPMKSLQDQLSHQTTTGPTMPLEHRLDASWVLPSLESCQSRTSTWDAGSPTHTWSFSCLVVLAEVWDSRDQSCSTTIGSMSALFSTTQTSSGGMCAEFCHATHQFQMPIASGALDRLQCSISTIVLATDTEWECLDTLHGMAPWTNQSCHTSLIRARMSLTVHSRETLTQRHSLSEEVSGSIFKAFA